MQPVTDKVKIVVDLGKDRYRPNTQNLSKNIKIDGKVYDEAKKIFLKNKSLSTVDLRTILDCSYEQSLAILDLLKQELVHNNLLLDIK